MMRAMSADQKRAIGGLAGIATVMSASRVAESVSGPLVAAALLVQFLLSGMLLAAAVWLLARTTERTRWFLLASGVAIAGIVFTVGYLRFGGYGTGYGDADDALTIVASGLANATDPYGADTYLGNDLSPMPGAGLMALPFYLVAGNAAWQAPVLLGGAVLVIAKLASPRTALLVLVTVLSSAGFVWSYILGSDFMLAGCYQLAAALVAVAAVRRAAPLPVLLGVGLVLGVTGTVRVSALVSLAAIALVLVAVSTARQWVPVFAAAGVTVAALTLPFLLLNGRDWDPLNVGGIAGSQLAQAAIAVLALAALPLIYAAARRMRGSSLLELAALPALLAGSLLPVLLTDWTQIYRAAGFLIFAAPWLAHVAVVAPVHSEAETVNA